MGNPWEHVSGKKKQNKEMVENKCRKQHVEWRTEGK